MASVSCELLNRLEDVLSVQPSEWIHLHCSTMHEYPPPLYLVHFKHNLCPYFVLV